LTSSGFNTPGGLATTSVIVVNVPPGNVVTMTVVNSGGTVRRVDPEASVVVNVTASGKVVMGLAVGEPSLCIGTLAAGLLEPCVVVGEFGDPAVESMPPGRSGDEGPVEAFVEEEPLSGWVEVDVSPVDGGVEVVVGVVLIPFIPPPPGDVEMEFDVDVDGCVSLVDGEDVEVSVVLVLVLVLSCAPLLDEELGGEVGGGVTEDDMVEVGGGELEGDDGGVSVTVVPLELDASSDIGGRLGSKGSVRWRVWGGWVVVEGRVKVEEEESEPEVEEDSDEDEESDEDAEEVSVTL
jgi:hypothetical protein